MTNKQPVQEKSRADLLVEMEAARRKYEQNLQNLTDTQNLVNLLYQAGSFWEARTLLQPLIESGQASVDSLALMANLETLHGHYAQAESLLSELAARQTGDRQTGDPSALLKTGIRRMMVYYQTGDFSKAQHLFDGAGDIQLPLWEQMKAFQDEQPYQISWHDRKEEIIPFVITDPLPIIEVEIQSKPIHVLIDTGGDSLYLDDQYAAELGIQPVGSAVGRFGGGVEGKIGYAVGRRLQLGNVTLDPIPVTIMPTQRWSKGFADGKYTIGGVIGTGILKQFLASMDYPAGRLLLRPRRTLSESGQAGVEIPFVLHQTHLMMARGMLNGFKPLTFFVDSGLAMQESFVAPSQTLQYIGIPVPETFVDENGIGGGGDGQWANGVFQIESLGLASLTQHHLTGNYGALVPETYWQNGFIQDGLISHSFLRHYRWTLDFEKMRYVFGAGEG